MIGSFTESEDAPPLEVDVTIGRTVIIACPEHGYSYGQFYSWAAKDLVANRRVGVTETRHRFVTSNGTLIYAWIKTSDVASVNQFNGVSCYMEGGNTVERSRKMKFRITGKGK